jgi:segregation and condensation protein A
MVWRKGKRRVSLVELINAFEEVKKEAELQKIINEKRATQREQDRKYYRRSIGDKLHKENLNEEIRMIYERICKYDGQPIPIRKIYEAEDIEDRITAMVSSLYLAHDQRIKLWQRNFPFGEIYIKNLHKELEEMDEEELDDEGKPKHKKQPRLVTSPKHLAA